MWMEKLLAGVLRVLTPLGPRYIKLSLAQRIYLLWIFRHFQVLPLQVLTPPATPLDRRAMRGAPLRLADRRGRMASSDPRNPGAPPAHRFAAAPAKPTGLGRSVALRGGRVNGSGGRRWYGPKSLCYIR